MSLATKSPGYDSLKVNHTQDCYYRILIYTHYMHGASTWSCYRHFTIATQTGTTYAIMCLTCDKHCAYICIDDVSDPVYVVFILYVYRSHRYSISQGGGLHVIDTLKARGSVIIYSNKDYNYHSLVQTVIKLPKAYNNNNVQS